MHGVPTDLNLAPFVGTSIYRIDLGLHIVHFRFATVNGLTLAVEGDWEIRDGDGRIVDRSLADDVLPSERDAYRVHVLLDRTVAATAVDPPRSLSLSFDSGHRLVVFDNSQQGESFHIDPPGIHV